MTQIVIPAGERGSIFLEDARLPDGSRLPGRDDDRA
jgi:hypothetical protein